jgi:hydroxymethylglutaryl-CoA reductase
LESVAGGDPGSWSGFYRLKRDERIAKAAAHAKWSDEERKAVSAVSSLRPELAEQFIENAIGSFPLPLGLAVGFLVDGKEVVVPMAIEESSVVAAASHGAKMAAAGGGFTTEVTEPITIGQVEVRGVRDTRKAAAAVKRRAPGWIGQLNASIPRMVERGGGVRAIVPRLVEGRLVVHLHVDTRDAMGANTVNALCERIGPAVAQSVGGRLGLRILSNLATERIAVARCAVPLKALGGKEVARGIVEANRFARVDPYRAATHNKGILNGIDPVLIATGNDWRAVEAGAHAYAAMEGTYRGLTKYWMSGSTLRAELRLPLAVGTVGGVTRLHPTARACLKLLGDPDARRLAGICAAVGLAQNLAALRALATEGIQRGHMELHGSNLALAAKAAKPRGAVRSPRKRKR